jgi:isocitrate lyase
MKAMIEAGAAEFTLKTIEFCKKCGHLGGKVLVQEAINKCNWPLLWGHNYY